MIIVHTLSLYEELLRFDLQLSVYWCVWTIMEYKHILKLQTIPFGAKDGTFFSESGSVASAAHMQSTKNKSRLVLKTGGVSLQM